MAFCVNCGNQLDERARFCNICGTSVSIQAATQSNELRASQNNTEVKSTQKERQTAYEGKLKKCPNCGGLVKSFSVVCEFCSHEFRDTRSSSMVEEFEKKYQSTKSEDKRILLIQSFSLPNTKEDVLEMFYLAAANVGKSDKWRAKEDSAWQSKFEQAYMKAGLLLRDDPERDRVEQIYKDKKQEIEKWKRSMFFSEYGIFFIMLAFLVVIGLVEIFK